MLIAVAGLVIPIGTGHNEASFSDLKLHRTRLRSSLGDATMDQLMRISQEGPEQHSPEYKNLRKRAVDYWAGKKERRFNKAFDVPSALKLARRRESLQINALKRTESNKAQPQGLKKLSSKERNARKRARARAARKAQRRTMRLRIKVNWRVE